MSVVFQNPGVADIRALTTMGLSVKEDESSAIGYFGTGFKYAVARLLREGAKVVLWLGMEPVEFLIKREEVRGKEHEFIFMRRASGEEVSLNITTQLGRNWELWMAFREFHSNALDEGGDSTVGKFHGPSAGDTTIVVSGSKAFETIANNKRHYFLEGRPAASTPQADIYEGATFAIYYRTVAINVLSSPCVVTYNMKNIILTEDRTAKSYEELLSQVRRAIGNLTNEDLLRKIARAKPNETFEGDLKFDAYEISLPTAKILFTMKAFIENVSLWKAVSERMNNNHTPTPGVFTKTELAKVGRAVAFLAKLGYPMDTFQVEKVDALPYNRKLTINSGQISLSPEAAGWSLQELLEALIPDIEGSLNTRWDIGTPKLLARRIIALGEQVAGEPA